MIPIKLELTNFLSYRGSAQLDFAGIHAACISGSNGAGKSSILDAITWALFGQSRAKSDDEAINRIAAAKGESAIVRFDFELEKTHYRVVRRKKLRRGAQLELQIGDGEGGWKTLSERKIRETQATIEKLLRMNYQTFINASFLLQGKADEFTTKTPGKRKEILADLIGASEWEGYKARFTEARKSGDGELALLDGRLEDIAAEMGESDARGEALAEAQAAHAQIKARLTDKEALLAQARRQIDAIKHQEQTAGALADQLQRAQAALERIQTTQTERQKERDGYQAILNQAEQITARFAQWEAADAAWGAWAEKENAYRTLERLQQPHLTAIAQEESALRQQQTNLQERKERLAAMAAEQMELTARIETAGNALAKLDAQLATATKNEAAWLQAKESLSEMKAARQLLEGQIASLEKEAARAQQYAEEREKVAQNHMASEQAATQLQEALAGSVESHRTLAETKAEQDNLSAEQSRLKTSMNELKERLERLEGDDAEACPLCGQPLTADHRADVLAELHQQGTEEGDRFRANQERITQLTEQAGELNAGIKQIPRLERDLATQQQRFAAAQAKLEEIDAQIAAWQTDSEPQLKSLQAQLADDDELVAQQKKTAELEASAAKKGEIDAERLAAQKEFAADQARLAEIDRAQQEWSESGEETLTLIAAQLAAEDFALDAREAAAELDEQMAAIGYDKAEQTAAEERQALADAVQPQNELQQAQAAVKPLERTLTDLAEQVAERQTQLAELTAQHEAESERLAHMQAEKPDLAAIEKEAFDLREEEISAARRMGAAQQRLDVLVDLKERRKNLQSERAALTQRIGRLKMLEKACGRDGVPALLIERAIPEIEDHANELLARLTADNMRIIFDTQRKLKSREGLAETLDIKISDNSGERPYENYSGGEQFRVNFSIRLALSRLLARRAGARLETLVIDEGFGSQDPNGRQRLVEAIHAVKDEFACLLIITHVDELRDAFDTRIEISKGNTGSQISIS